MFHSIPVKEVIIARIKRELAFIDKLLGLLG